MRHYLKFSDMPLLKLFQFKHVSSIDEDNFFIVAHKRFGLDYVDKECTRDTNYNFTSVRNAVL